MIIPLEVDNGTCTDRTKLMHVRQNDVLVFSLSEVEGNSEWIKCKDFEISVKIRKIVQVNAQAYSRK